MNVDLVGLVIRLLISVGGWPQQHEPRTLRDCHIAERGISEHLAIVSPKWRFDPTNFLNKGRYEVRLATQSILKPRSLSKDAGSGPKKACRRLAARGHKNAQDSEGLHFVEFAVGHSLGTSPDHVRLIRVVNGT